MGVYFVSSMTAEILKKIEVYNKTFDKEKVKEAYDFALEKYNHTEGTMQYPLRVLEVILPLKPDEDTIIAVLLHDLYVMGFLVDNVVLDLFGQSTFKLLASFKKLYELNYAENDKTSQIEILRKMFLTMAKDIRVILIWLAQRLHRMERLDDFYGSSANKDKLAKETMEVYVPIASRLGVYRIKTQLEDLSFKYLNTKEHIRISKQIEEFGESRKEAIEGIRKRLEDFLKSKGVDAFVFGRFKSVYSIYRKLERKGLSHVSELYDLFAIRVILPTCEKIDHLYSILGLIHSEWKPLSSRFKDYVAVPKPNGYRSLHTVVLGIAPKDMDQPVEIQIRDDAMHREGEYGIASHWAYKGNVSVGSQSEWIRGLEKIHEFFGVGAEAMKEVEVDVFKDRIFVLTPRGEVKDLTVGSIPIDFAYAVHTDVGNRCVMAKVNQALVPLDYELKNGDVVEIITRKDAFPKLRWLSLVKSSFARHKIKAYFSSLNRDNNLKEGRRLINTQLERLNKPLLDQNYSILKAFGGQKLNISRRESLVEEVGKGSKLASDIVRKIYPYEKNLATKKIISKAEPSLSKGAKKRVALSEQVVVGGEEGLPIKIASCCKPKMTNSIIGYVTRGNSITIHKSGCRLLGSLTEERFISAHWKGQKPSEGGFKVGIKVTCVSRVGLIHDITSVVTLMGINILDVMIKQTESGFYEDCFLLDLDDLDKFDRLLNKIEEINGVMKVVRDDKFK